MRIAHLDQELLWRGGQRQVLLLLDGLRRRGVDATLIAAPNSTLAAKAAERGVPVREIAARGEVDPVALRRIVRLARTERFDVLHAHTSHAHGLAVLASLFLPRVRTVIHRRVDFPPGRDPLNRWKYRARPDRYIAISHEVRRVLVAAGVAESKIEVVHSAVTGMDRVSGAREDVRRELGLSPDAVLVGNVANLSDHKGHVYLIDAARALCREKPGLYVVIVGRGELERALKRRVAEAGLAGRVLFTGFRDDVPRWLSAFDVFAMTSHTEGLCTSLLDAMSVGVPVVATDAGGIPEIVQDDVNGLLARSRDPLDIAAKLARAVDDALLRARVVGAGERTVRERFSVDRMVEGTIAAYARLGEAAR
jgi:glycosyltransferase involved in cell wall biosynthesis